MASDQGNLFDGWDDDDPLPDPGENRVGPMHRDAGDTESEAAEQVMPRSGTWRRAVLDAVVRSGDRGMTDWELHVELGGNLYTIAPRRNELLRDGWVVDSGRRRPTNNGTRARVWTLSRRGREQLGATA